MTTRDDGHGPARSDDVVDAAFAFAVTLLVISVGDPPETFDGLRQALLSIPAFAAGFAIIALFWWMHRVWSTLALFEALGAHPAAPAFRG